MTELELITDLRPEAPLPGPGELIQARGRLTAAIAAERADRPVPELSLSGTARSRRVPAGEPRARPFWSARRLALTAAAAAAAVALAAAAILVRPGHSEPSASRPGPATVNVAAALFLRQAAAAIRRLPAHPPRPDQFVYTEAEGAGASFQYRTWLSADGSRPGLERNTGQRSFVIPPCTAAQAERTHCAEQAGYLPALPADPDRLFAYLEKIGVAQPADRSTSDPAWAANDFGKAVDFLMQTTYLRPAQQAALFELMARTPGFTIVPGVRDAVGRPGVGIRWTFLGSKAMIIVSARTYAYLGDRTWPSPGFHGPGANLYDGAALVKMAFVDKAGQLP